MSDKTKLEVKIAIAGILIAILTSMASVVWYSASMMRDIYHIEAQVQKNSDTIKEIIKFIVKDKK